MDHTPEHWRSRGGHPLPSWLRPGDPESRFPVLAALAVAITLQITITDDYTWLPRWPLVAMEILLVAVLVWLNPLRLTRSTRLGRWANWILLAAITIDNTLSAVVLNLSIISGVVSDKPVILLGSGGAIYITNMIIFGIWYWELDRGGPVARRAGTRSHPDFLFPQMTNPELAPPDWRPTFVDYLYVSATNVMAFSPTDTMPMTRWAKAMMAVQAAVALLTAALVIARAVNVLV